MVPTYGNSGELIGTSASLSSLPFLNEAETPEEFFAELAKYRQQLQQEQVQTMSFAPFRASTEPDAPPSAEYEESSVPFGNDSIDDTTEKVVRSLQDYKAKMSKSCKLITNGNFMVALLIFRVCRFEYGSNW